MKKKEIDTLIKGVPILYTRSMADIDSTSLAINDLDSDAAADIVIIDYQPFKPS